jgi:ADP-ribose pyrophosphatase
MTDSDDLAWETLDSQTAYECPGFDIIHESVRLPDGTESDFDYLSEPPAVVVLPFTTENEVVVIEEWRQAVKRVNLGLPVGSVESDDEDFEAAAHRELQEETGYEADRVEHLCSVEPTDGLADSVHHYFSAHECTPTGKQDLDFNESIEPSTTTLGNLRDAIHTGDIQDGRTVLAVLYYEAFWNDRDDTKDTNNRNTERNS